MCYIEVYSVGRQEGEHNGSASPLFRAAQRVQVWRSNHGKTACAVRPFMSSRIWANAYNAGVTTSTSAARCASGGRRASGQVQSVGRTTKTTVKRQQEGEVKMKGAVAAAAGRRMAATQAAEGHTQQWRQRARCIRKV